MQLVPICPKIAMFSLINNSAFARYTAFVACALLTYLLARWTITNPHNPGHRPPLLQLPVLWVSLFTTTLWMALLYARFETGSDPGWYQRGRWDCWNLSLALCLAAGTPVMIGVLIFVLQDLWVWAMGKRSVVYWKE